MKSPVYESTVLAYNSMLTIIEECENMGASPGAILREVKKTCRRMAAALTEKDRDKEDAKTIAGTA